MCGLQISFHGATWTIIGSLLKNVFMVTPMYLRTFFTKKTKDKLNHTQALYLLLKDLQIFELAMKRN